MINFPVKRVNNRVLSPFSELDSWQREMDQIFDLAFPGLGINGTSPAHAPWMPALDVVDEENQILIAMDLPGLTKRDIKLAVEGRQLTIQGERRSETRETTGRFTRRERGSGIFGRRIPLPASVDTSKIKASFRDGVLQIRLPKNDDHKPKQIEVQIE